MRFSRKAAWGLLAAGIFIYLMPDLLGAILAAVGAAALLVSEETYRKRKREAMRMLAKVGLAQRPGGDGAP